MDVAARTSLITSLEQLWHGWSDLRFGQMLREAVGEPAIRCPGDIADDAIRQGTTRALRTNPGLAPPPGPYWDTEPQSGSTFADGRPRDPARIARVCAALTRAWDAHPSLTLGQLVELALERGGVSENEYRSRLLLIEDGTLRGLLERLAS